MAFLRPHPYPLGTVIPVRVPRGATATVHAPNGMEYTVPAPLGTFDLALTHAGEWRWTWGNDEWRTATAQNEAAPAAAPAPRVTRPRGVE